MNNTENKNGCGNNPRKGKVLFKLWVGVDELRILLESNNPEQVFKTLEEIKLRGDILDG